MRRLALAICVTIAACDRVVDLTVPDGSARPDVIATPDAGIDGPGDAASDGDAAVSFDAAPDAL